MAKSDSKKLTKKKSEPHPAPVNSLESPRFAGLSTFMRLPHIADAKRLDVALIGVPFDGGTSYRTGTRFGPRHIREQSAIIRPYNPVLKISPFELLRVADYGDLPVNPLSINDSFKRITRGLGPVLEANTIPICVGGDHSILLPILRAMLLWATLRDVKGRPAPTYALPPGARGGPLIKLHLQQLQMHL